MDTHNDLTEGRVSKKILSFFFPMLCTNLLQQIYSVADTAVVGKGIGDNALAAVGIAATVSLLITGFLMGLSHGFSVIIAQRYGSGDYQNLRRTVWQSVRLCTAAALLLTLFSVIFLGDILRIMQTDVSILNDTLIYGRIIFGGLGVTAAYNLCSGFLRALGDSKTPFKAIIVSSAVNILLDIIFVFGLKTGVAGAAAATVSAQLISVIICVLKIRKIGIMKFEKDDFSRDNESCVLLLKNGLPIAFMNSITAVGCMIVQSHINGLGAEYAAAYSVCSKYLNLFMLPSITAGFTVSAFTGQNFGAGKFDRIRAGVRVGILIVITACIILGVSMNRFSKELASFMLSGENAVMFTAQYLNILGFTLIGVSCIFIFRNAVQGMGCQTVPMLSGIIEMLLRLVFIYILIPKFDFLAVAYADVAAWTGALALNITAYIFLIKRKK